MQGSPAIYLGRIVDKNHFRAFIYSSDGSQKLVESWDEYERHMELGTWFALKEDAMTRIDVEKPKREKKEPKPKVVNEVVNELIEDDFLPKEGE